MNFQTFSYVLVILSTHFLFLLKYGDECLNRSSYYILAGALCIFFLFHFFAGAEICRSSLQLLLLHFRKEKSTTQLSYSSTEFILLGAIPSWSRSWSWWPKISNPNPSLMYFSDWCFHLKKCLVSVLLIMSFEFYNLIKSPDDEMGVEFPSNTQRIAFNTNHYFFSFTNKVPPSTNWQLYVKWIQ